MKKMLFSALLVCAFALLAAGSAFAQQLPPKAPEMASLGQLFAAISGFAGYYAIRRRKA